MKPNTRNLLLLLVVVAIVAIPFLPLWGSGGPAAGDDDDGNVERPVARGGAQDLPALRLDLLQTQRDILPGSGRNIFAGGAAVSLSRDDSADDEEVVETIAATEVAPVAESVEEMDDANTGRLAGYDYLGLVQTSDGFVATFAFRGLTYYGRVGQTINNTFEIKDITKTYVTIRVLSGDFEQRLRLSAPGAATTGGDQ